MTKSKALLYTLLFSGVACCSTSCTEQKRLKSEIEATKARMTELREEHEGMSEHRVAYKDGLDTLKNHPIMRKGQRAVEAEISNWEASIGTLEQRKKDLQADLDALGKELSEYKSKNL